MELEEHACFSGLAFGLHLQLSGTSVQDIKVVIENTVRGESG
jgi:hypothetical protein